MSTRRTLTSAAASAAIALAAAPAAGAQTPIPTVRTDLPCYSTGDTIAVQGAGFSANTRLDGIFGANSHLMTWESTADAQGVVDFKMDAPDPAALLKPDEDVTDVHLIVNDRSRIDANAQPPESQYAATTFRLSRWAVFTTSRRLVPGRSATLQAIGFTYGVGGPLYAHYRRGSRTIKSVRLGTLRGPCGDLRVKVRDAFPFRRVPAGAYRLSFNMSRTDAVARPSLSYTVRVSRRDARR